MCNITQEDIERFINGQSTLLDGRLPPRSIHTDPVVTDPADIPRYSHAITITYSERKYYNAMRHDFNYHLINQFREDLQNYCHKRKIKLYLRSEYSMHFHWHGMFEINEPDHNKYYIIRKRFEAWLNKYCGWICVKLIDNMPAWLDYITKHPAITNDINI